MAIVPFTEMNLAPCPACGRMLPCDLLESPGEIGNRKYMCYECCGMARPSPRGTPKEEVDRLMKKYGRETER